MKQAPAPLSYPGPGTPWENRNAPRNSTFEVIKVFEDAEGDSRPVGERWAIIGTGFNKFEDMMWLRLRVADGTEWLMPLEWRDQRQGDVLDYWHRYTKIIT